MGSQISKQKGSVLKQQSRIESMISQSISTNRLNEYFLIDPVELIKFSIQSSELAIVWIEPRVYRDQHTHTIRLFYDRLRLFEQFESIEELSHRLQKANGNRIIRVIAGAALPNQFFKLMNRNRFIDQIILFCQNKLRAIELMSRYSKIKSSGFTANQVLGIVKSQCHYKNTVLFPIKQDIPLINKYSINYFSFLRHTDRQLAKQQFVQLAKNLFPNKGELITEFANLYQLEMTDTERNTFVKDWIFKNSFYWELIDRLSKVSSDPKRLAYLRMPFKDIHEAIKEAYKEMKKNPKTIYIVTQLSDDEVEKLEQNTYNFLMFTTYVKGFTNLSQANAYLKAQKTLAKRMFMFDVAFPKRETLQDELDFGYIINPEQKQNGKADVVFNIFNCFKIREFQKAKQQGTLIYGALAQAYKKRQQIEKRANLTKLDKELLKIFDIQVNTMSKVRDQSSVFRLSGCFSESIIHCESRIKDIRRSNQSVIELDVVRLQKANALKLYEQYDAAIQTYSQVKTEPLNLIATLRMIDIYFSRNDIQRARMHFQRLKPFIDLLKQQWGEFEEHYRARHYECRLMMEEGKYREALVKAKRLKDDILEKYDYRTINLEFMDQVLENIEVCCKRINISIVRNSESSPNVIN